MADLPTSRPSPEDKARIEAVVAACIEALERGEADPATRLCANDPDLLTRVQRRLAHLASRGLIPDSEMLPRAIGPYRVLRELGSGGMGHVYLADQLEPMRRQVALKVIKLGMDTREVVARFQAERQALARMNHPNIAQVFDAGITTEGRPYFVMEFVGGQTLTAFCDVRVLPTEARVRLMVTICRAVQHAHDRGFIHRDLKPSNILVTEHEGEFVPKVIDFGVAKATAAAAEASTAAASLRTRADQVLGTPEYMSPEQMSSGGLDVDTRTDVYSLGVTLYELLCGELPFDSRRLRSVGRGELERILRDELPTQPSKRLSLAGVDVVAARGGERSTVQRTVAGELDWITLRALAKHREQRYPSALALAEDLERWLRHEPVHAAPPGRTYRLRKFVRRHRVGVGAGAAVLLSLVAGLVTSAIAAREARAAELRATLAAADALAAQGRESAALGDMKVFFGLARDAVGNLVDVASAQLAEVPQAEPVRRQLLADAMAFYETLRARLPGDPGLRRERLQAIQRIGQLQRQLGEATAALATFEQCVAEATELQREHADDAAAALLLVDTTSQLAGALSALGRGPAAQATYTRALAALDAARPLHTHATEPLLAREARLLANLAIELDEHDTPRALELFERAFAAFDRLGTTHATASRERARVAVDYATTLTRANRIGDAATALADAVARLHALPPDRSTSAREAEATLHEHLAIALRRLDRRREARAAQMRAIEIASELATEHPEVMQHADDVAAGWHFLAQLDEAEARLDDARRSAQEAVQRREALVARFPANHRLVMRCVRSLLLLADVELQVWQREAGPLAAAVAPLTRAIALVDPLHAAHADDLDVLITYASVHAAMGALRVGEKAFDAALKEHTAAHDALAAQLPALETQAELHYHLATAGSNLFQVYYLMGRPAEALAAGEKGLQHAERGLVLDARHVPLRDLVPTLAGRIATARFSTDDFDGGIAMLQTMCQREAWGPDTREQGCLLLMSRIDDLTTHPDADAWRQQLAEHLRSVIAARGALADALRRPAQQTGFSHVRSRLRDFDLRVALAVTAAALGRRDEQARCLDEAAELERTLPGISGDRLRNLFAQRGELALLAGDGAGAEAAADELLRRAGEQGGGNYIAAVLLARAITTGPPAADQERLAGKAVKCLGRAIATGEVPARAAAHENFAPLRGREDYEALRLAR